MDRSPGGIPQDISPARTGSFSYNNGSKQPLSMYLGQLNGSLTTAYSACVILPMQNL